MTRIFDALRKSRAVAPAAPPAPEPTPPMHAVAGRAAAAVARLPVDRGAIVPLGPCAPVNSATVREMTGLRIHLEAVLGARVPRTLMLVSAQPGEGTSTVALQFAEIVARSAGQRVLLVDANRLHSSPLLLEGRTRAAERSGRGGLDLFPLADRVSSGGTLAPAAVREALDVIGAGYDWIVVDAPALLESPEAAPLAAIADGTVIVVQAGRTKRPVLSRANDMLRRAGANVLGTVLNRRRLEIPDFIYRRI